MLNVRKVGLSCLMLMPLCAMCADNTWQKGSYSSLTGNWNESGHWSGGVPVAAPPTGDGDYLQRAVFPSGSYTVTFPEGDTVSTANLTLNTFNGNTKLFSGLGSRFLLAATDADNYQKDNTAQAFRLNFAVSSGNNQGARVVVSDYRAPLALFTNFTATVSLVDKHGKIALDGGFYDFLTPTGGTARTDTTVSLGYEGLGGNFSSDATMTTELKGGAVLRTPLLEMGSGFRVNSLVFDGATGVVGRTFTMGGTKNGTSDMTQCVTLDNGAQLKLGVDLSDPTTGTAFTTPTAERAKVLHQTREILVTGGSTLHSDGKFVVNSGRTTLRVEDGSLFSSVGEVHIPNDSFGTGSVVVVDAELRLTRELNVGHSSGLNESMGRLYATNATISANHIYGRMQSEMVIAGTSDVTVNKNFALGTVDYGVHALDVYDDAEICVPGVFYVAQKGRAKATVHDGTVSAKQVIVAETKNANGTLTIAGGDVSATDSVCMGWYSGTSGSLVMTDGSITSPYVYTYYGTGTYQLDGGTVNTKNFYCEKGSATLSADGGTIHVTGSGGRMLENFSPAELGEKGLTVDTAYGLTLAQDFVSKSSVTGLLAFAGGSTLTVPSGRTIDAALWMKGGTTLSYAGAKLGGLILGEADSAATVNLTLGSPIAVTGDVDVRKARLVIAGTCETDVTYPLVTCTGDVSAEAAAAWAASELVVTLSPMQYAELSVVDGASGGKVLQMSVKEMKVIPLVVNETDTIVTNITLNVHDQLDITVADGKTLTLTGTVTGDSIVKRGTGALVINGAQTLATGAYLFDGTLTLVSDKALGAAGLYLRGGTLAIPTAATLASPVVIAPENEALAVVLKTDADVTMPLPTMSGGALLKRGAGKLTLNVGATSAFLPASSVGGSRAKTDDVSFPASGVVPKAAYRGVHVIEGELVFKAVADGATIVSANSIAVGINTKDGTAEPKLTLDGVSYTASGKILENACYLNSARCFAANTHVALTNGAALTVGTYHNLQATETTTPCCTLDVDASTVTATDTYWANESDKWNYALTTFRNGSALYAGTVKIMGAVSQHVFDDSTLSGNANGGLTSFFQQDNKTATFTFRNGATLSLKTIDGNSDRRSASYWYSFIFEGATWNMGAANVTFTTPKTHFRIQTSGEGVVWAPPSGVTWTIAKDILGDGKITVNGAGTVNFNGAAFEGRTFGGTGTIAGCTIGAATLAVDLADDWTHDGALTFDGSFPTGKVTVDLGRTAENPMSETLAPFVAAKYTGDGTPGVTSWRLKNAGFGNVRAAFAAADGDVTVMPRRVGMMLIVR